MKTNISAPVSLAQVLALGAIGLLAGCSSYPESHVVSAPPPPPPMAQQPATVYTTVPAPATTATVQTPSGTYAVPVPSPVGASSVVVMQAPPQAQQEVPTARPSRDHAWVAGYWSWSSTNSRYEWRAGHWEVPPRAGAVWVPPRWQPEGTSWRFYEGYWD